MDTCERAALRVSSACGRTVLRPRVPSSSGSPRGYQTPQALERRLCSRSMDRLEPKWADTRSRAPAKSVTPPLCSRASSSRFGGPSKGPESDSQQPHYQPSSVFASFVRAASDTPSLLLLRHAATPQLTPLLIGGFAAAGIGTPLIRAHAPRKMPSSPKRRGSPNVMLSRRGVHPFRALGLPP